MNLFSSSFIKVVELIIFSYSNNYRTKDNSGVAKLTLIGLDFRLLEFFFLEVKLDFLLYISRKYL